MENNYKAFTNIYKLMKKSSLKYGPVSYSMNSENLVYEFSFLEGEILLEIYEDGKLKERKTSVEDGISIIGQYYSTTQLKPLMKKLFLQSINEISNNKTIELEYEVAELSDYALIKNKNLDFEFLANGKKATFIISHIDTEAVYRINGEEVGFYKFVEYLNKNSIDFKLLKKSLVKKIESNTVGYGADVKKRDFESLGLKKKIVDGRVEVDFEGLLRKKANTDKQEKVKEKSKKEDLSNEGGITKSKTLDKILFGKKANKDGITGKVTNKKS